MSATTVKAVNTERVLTADFRDDVVVVSVMEDEISIDGMVIAISRADWDQIVAEGEAG